MTIAEDPKYDKKSESWSVPEGCAHPKCKGCGHNYYDARPIPKVNGVPVLVGLCQWCLEEMT